MTADEVSLPPGGPGGSNVVDLPSALTLIGRLSDVLALPAAVFCDYDGTLTPITDHPAAATLSSETRTILRRLSTCLAVVVVSGRDLEDVRSLVDVAELVYVGSHGFEITMADGRRFEPPGASDFLPHLDAASSDLGSGLEGLDGVFVERKRFAVTVHTRLAESQRVRAEAARLVQEAAVNHRELSLTWGKEVMELRPGMAWDKGSAVSLIADRLSPRPMRIMYLGDDRTDEDAFRSAAGLGGITIIVGASGTSLADYRLEAPSEVAELLSTAARVVCHR